MHQIDSKLLKYRDLLDSKWLIMHFNVYVISFEGWIVLIQI